MLKVIEMRNVSVVRNKKFILKNINISIGKNENIAIIGPNGSGKTTFLKLISGDIRPYFEEDESSEIKLFEKTNWNIFELRNKIGIVSMDLQNMFLPNTLVSDVILSGYFGSVDIYRNHKVKKEMVKKVYNSAVLMGIEDLLEREIENLSLGEMRRALIARALISEPELLILDEPMTGLDIVMKDAFRKMFDILVTNGVNIIMITHELEDVPDSVKRIAMIKDGSILVDGEKEEVLTSKNVSLLYGKNIKVDCENGIYSMRMGH